MPTMLQQKISATDDLLQTVAANLEEIRLILKNLNASRAKVTPNEMDLTNHGQIAEINAGAAILEVCTGTMLAAMFASEVMGENPAEHVQFFFDRQMKVLRGCYGGDTRGEVPDESKPSLKIIT